MTDEPADQEIPEAIPADLSPPARAPEPAPAVPEDVTDAMRAAGHLSGDDWNPEDTVWLHDGVRVKVKTFWDPNSAVGFDVYRISGSIVGEDGKAMLGANGAPLVFPFGRHLTWQADADGDLAAAILNQRIECVTSTARAFRNTEAGRAIPGVGANPAASRIIPPASPAISSAPPVEDA